MFRITRKQKKRRNNKLHVHRNFRDAPHFELCAGNSEIFYRSQEWLQLRYKVLIKYGRKCMLCGATSAQTTLHVDHIRPRYLYPELALNIKNLQVLCRDCNVAKGIKREDDFRPKTVIRRQGKQIENTREEYAVSLLLADLSDKGN